MISIKSRSQGLAAAMLSLGLATLGQSAMAQTAECEYQVSNDWGSGATATIRITNTGSSTINGWDVNWSYDNSNITSSWNANVSGNNPYSASNLGWNGNIQPGQSVEFGMQLNNNGGSAEVPQVEGDVCGGTPPTSSSSSSASSTPPVSSSSSSPSGNPSQCNWYGTLYPLCDDQNTGWGWENNESCIGFETCDALPDPWGPVGDEEPPASSSSSSSSSSSEPPVSSSSSSTSSSSSSPGETEGRFRVDESGNITRNGSAMPVQCGSWFGLEGRHEPEDDPDNPGGAPMELFVGNMWWANGGEGTGRTIEQTMQEITAQGINVVRLPIAPQTLDPNDPQGTGDVLKNHESVRQDNARQALEDFIVTADEHDINVVVGIHSCSNYLGWRAGRLDATPPYADADREGYEYTREDYACGSEGVGPDVTVHEYNESIWLDNLRTIAGLQDDLGVDNILGIDIFNEPWDYTWEEWKTLAESAYQAIDEVNSDVLIFVQGIGSVTSDDTEIPHGDEATNPNWGENLFQAGDNPLNIPKDRLVFSPHTYGPSVFVQNHFLDPNQTECEGLEETEAADAGCNVVIDPERLRAGWEEHFGYLRDQGYAMVIGEFGGNMDWPEATRPAVQENWSHIQPGVDREWQEALVDYMTEKDIQGCYWSINPESADTWGWYEHAYEHETNEDGWGTWLDFDPRKTELLQRLWNN